MLTPIENYKKLLFTYPQEEQGYKTYAIVDSIRDEGIKEKMVFSELNYLDLWDAELVENEQETPLYLIELQEDDTLTAWLIENHDKGATVYLQSTYDIETIQAYYSGYTFPYVEMEAKGYDDETPRGIFGFYDPLVFPRFMQTLYTQEKRERFFAGASLFFIPSATQKNLCELYYLNKDAAIALKPWHTNKKPPHIKQEKLYANPRTPHYETHTIDKKQVATLERLAYERFVKEVVEDLYDEGHLAQAVETLLPKALDIAAYAKTLGIDSQANMARLIQIGLHLPKPIEHYANTNEFKAISQEHEQVKKRDLLQTLLKEMKLKEAS
jgi:hypothetical protein